MRAAHPRVADPAPHPGLRVRALLRRCGARQDVLAAPALGRGRSRSPRAWTAGPPRREMGAPPVAAVEAPAAIARADLEFVSLSPSLSPATLPRTRARVSEFHL